MIQNNSCTFSNAYSAGINLIIPCGIRDGEKGIWEERYRVPFDEVYPGIGEFLLPIRRIVPSRAMARGGKQRALSFAISYYPVRIV